VQWRGDSWERHAVDVMRGDVEYEVELRQFFDGEGSSYAAGECAPNMDVLETASGIEILMDLPGVVRGDVRILISQGTLVVAGRKLPGRCAHQEAAFHLAERGFGRFVRVVRLAGAVDAGRAVATLAAGLLRIALPRIEERRGRDMRIQITQP
jgi:HSP20 family protein